MKDYIQSGRGIVGIELGSTRIKAVLIGPDYAPAASGDFTWENRLEDGYWTYHMDEVWNGIRSAFAALKADVLAQYGVPLTRLAGVGVSAMMHGYLAFDADGKLLAPFRTWRNTTTAQAAAELTALFGFNIPQRWSIAHLHQAVLNGEEHVGRIASLNTLAGYVHWQLSGEQVLGVGDASGMFPIDSATGTYDRAMMDKYEALAAGRGCGWKLSGLLPRVVSAGEDAGRLTEAGARLLDPTGKLQPGALMAPPEGDAGTGMTATNSVAPRTGNVSAGTSVFAMIVMEKPLSKVYEEIDMVTTPTGAPVAMVHCNNCTSDINAWAAMLQEFSAAAGRPASMNDVYGAIFRSAMTGEPDCGGNVNVNYLSGEPVTGFEEGRPLTVRMPDPALTFANFSRALVFGAMISLRLGMDILSREDVAVDRLLGHGGFFKTPGTAQKLMAGALNIPVSVMKTAGEGGPWGMALLAAYRVQKKEGQTLEQFLNDEVFAATTATAIAPDPTDVQGFAAYAARFVQALKAERAAVDAMR